MSIIDTPQPVDEEPIRRDEEPDVFAALDKPVDDAADEEPDEEELDEEEPDETIFPSDTPHVIKLDDPEEELDADAEQPKSESWADIDALLKHKGFYPWSENAKPWHGHTPWWRGTPQEPRSNKYEMKLPYRTVSQGQTLPLTDDLVLAVIKQLHAGGKYKHVVLMIDTAICFMVAGKDMSSATNNNLRNDVEKLRSPEVGADILFLHHATKAMSKEEMTLQNVLRDTSDFGAMADCIFGLRRDDKLFDFGDGPEEVDVLCVKTRAPETPKPFRFRLKRAPKPGEDRPVSVIEETGALQYVGDAENDELMGERLTAILRSNSATTMRMLKDELRLGISKIKALAQRQGWVLKPVPVFDPKTGRKKTFLWSQVVSADAVSPEDINLNSGSAEDINLDSEAA